MTPPTFKDFAVEFMSTHAAVNNRPSEEYQKALALSNHLLPAFGTKCLDDIRQRDIAVYKANKQKQGLANKTINNHLTILSKLLHCAAEWDVIEATLKIKKLPVRQTAIRWLKEDEAQRLIHAAKDEAEVHLWVMIKFAMHTGLRAGEIIALRWKDVDLDTKSMHVQIADWQGVVGPTKSGKARVVPLNGTLVAMLKKHMHGPTERVFWRVPGGAKWRYRTMYYQLKKVARSVGLADIGWHTFRHTFASHLAQGGVPLYHIKELLGHSTIDMTQRYAHLCPENCLEPAVETLIERLKF